MQAEARRLGSYSQAYSLEAPLMQPSYGLRAKPLSHPLPVPTLQERASLRLVASTSEERNVTTSACSLRKKKIQAEGGGTQTANLSGLRHGSEQAESSG